jgi:hypothetical protein
MRKDEKKSQADDNERRYRRFDGRVGKTVANAFAPGDFYSDCQRVKST